MRQSCDCRLPRQGPVNKVSDVSGYRIMAITQASQACDVGSIPTSRSNLPKTDSQESVFLCLKDAKNGPEGPSVGVDNGA